MQETAAYVEIAKLALSKLAQWHNRVPRTQKPLSECRWQLWQGVLHRGVNWSYTVSFSFSCFNQDRTQDKNVSSGFCNVTPQSKAQTPRAEEHNPSLCCSRSCWEGRRLLAAAHPYVQAELCLPLEPSTPEHTKQMMLLGLHNGNISMDKLESIHLSVEHLKIHESTFLLPSPSGLPSLQTKWEQIFKSNQNTTFWGFGTVFFWSLKFPLRSSFQNCHKLTRARALPWKKILICTRAQVLESYRIS